MIAITLTDDIHIASLVLADDVAAGLRTGDAEARRLVSVGCEALIDALVATYAEARYGLNQETTLTTECVLTRDGYAIRIDIEDGSPEADILAALRDALTALRRAAS